MSNTRTARGQLVGALAALLVLHACTVAVPTPERVTGKYRGQFTEGTELLTLHEDGRYEETFTLLNGRMVENEGTWQQDRPTHPRRVVLKSAIVRFSEGNGQKVDWEFIPGMGFKGAELRATPDPDGANVLQKE